jgi:hypothetical protein
MSDRTRADLQEANRRLHEENAALRADVARLREAAEFYADETNYTEGIENEGSPFEHVMLSDVAADKGRRARAALGSTET